MFINYNLTLYRYHIKYIHLIHTFLCIKNIYIIYKCVHNFQDTSIYKILFIDTCFILLSKAKYLKVLDTQTKQ